jgi:hypothetical protein
VEFYQDDKENGRKIVYKDDKTPSKPTERKQDPNMMEPKMDPA